MDYNYIRILSESPNYLAINKPAGLMVHSDGRTSEQTLADFILEKYPELSEVGEPMEIDGKVIARPGIVHRLDKDTSGVIIVAKNREAFEHLKNQFKNKEVAKVYHAFVIGNIKEDRGMIDSPIGKSRNDFRQWSASKNARGKIREALTYFNVLQRGRDNEQNICLLEVKPKTGRTHQIRVHMKSIQHPVVCDSLYIENPKPALGFERLALHARSISFTDLDGNFVNVEAPYPDDFQKAVLVLG